MDIPKKLDELYEKAVREGMVPWNDAPCPECGGTFDKWAHGHDPACTNVHPPEYQPDEEPGDDFPEEERGA